MPHRLDPHPWRPAELAAHLTTSASRASSSPMVGRTPPIGEETKDPSKRPTRDAKQELLCLEFQLRDTEFEAQKGESTVAGGLRGEGGVDVLVVLLAECAADTSAEHGGDDAGQCPGDRLEGQVVSPDLGEPVG